MDVKIHFDHEYRVEDTTDIGTIKILMLKGEKGEGGTPTQAQTNIAVADYLDEHPEAVTNLPDRIKQALLACFQKVAWVDANGQTYYNNLYNALMNKAVLSISAVFTQGSAVIYERDDLDTLREYLVVTASYDDGTTGEVTAYELSGTLTEGTSTITVTYSGKTATFDVTVTSNLLYRLPTAFASDGSNSIDSGVSLTDNAITTLLCDATISTFDASQRSIFGNQLLSSETQQNGLRTQLSSGYRYVWGSGLSWSDGKGFAANGDRVRFVLILRNGETYSTKWAIKNVTQATTKNGESTVQNVYHNSNTMRLGKTFTDGFFGTVHTFTMVNYELTDSEITDFLANGETA